VDSNCRCFEPCYTKKKWRELEVHPDDQDRNSEAWLALLNLIEAAAKDKREEFAPKQDLGPELWNQIKTLPPEISMLTYVKHLQLYGSKLVRIPPEIGEMKSLEIFTPYTSYNLHWFPYEITQCKNLKESTVSTRALYGNYKYRPPFPRLRGNPVKFVNQSKCSICGNPAGERELNQVWISLRVATDVLPLLVHTCSKECIEKVPAGHEGYIPTTHKGGLGLSQPPRKW
jgi:hypothetical protein